MKKTKKEIYRHGELLLVPCELPKEAKLQKETKKYIVAHSETGHHHVLESIDNYKVYTWEGDTYIEIPNVAKLLHEKTGEHVHKTHIIQPSVYKVNIKKSYDYFQKRLERVRD